MRALYDLARRTASFDFFSWLVLAKAAGATQIIVDDRRPNTNKWREVEIRERLSSIIMPGSLFAGLQSQRGREGRDPVEVKSYDMVRALKPGRFERLRYRGPAIGASRYTVTLRKDPRRPERNSNELAWRTFAAEIGAQVIDDYTWVPIGLEERMALYAGAEMNFGVPNGPLHLCSLTEYPVAVFCPPVCEGLYQNAGIQSGEQPAWYGSGQHLVWAADELPNLRRWFAEWRAAQDTRVAS